MAVIYKATNNINGKSYIGFDSNWPTRQKKHIWHALNGKEENRTYFHKAMVKYGVENFSWNIIRENATLEDEINLINEHNTFWTNGYGYNLTMGGEGNLGWIPTEETKKNIGKSNKGNKNCLGRVMSEETRKKISESLKGYKHSEKTRKKLSLASKGRKQSPETISKRVLSKMGYKHSEETRQKIKEGLRNNPYTEDAIKKIRAGSLKGAEKMKEIGHTEETKRKISESHKKRRSKKE